MNGKSSCPFCEVTSQIIDSNSNAFVLRDLYPVSQGHTLIIPKRHCQEFFQLNEEEILDCYRLLKKQKEELKKTIQPDGFNVGVNVGKAAGQSISHVHIHLIPRFKGDFPYRTDDIRHFIPNPSNE